MRHLVTLIEIFMHLIRVNPGHICHSAHFSHECLRFYNVHHFSCTPQPVTTLRHLLTNFKDKDEQPPDGQGQGYKIIVFEPS